MSDSSGAINQSDIEALLAQAHAASGEPAASGPTSKGAAPLAQSTPQANALHDSAISQSDIEALLNQADQAIASIDQPLAPLPSGVRSFQFRDLSAPPPGTRKATLELVRDVQLDLTIELGRTHMQLEDILKLQQGAVVPLDKLAGDPADIYVNGRLIARGEILVLNDNFCVRVQELLVGESACA